MSDPAEPPPPKPKPGSLRDRIAAFEKPNASATPAPARPPVRPKPGNITWKPAPPSPTSLTSNTGSENEEHKRAGMSASDAKESIGRGGSLKDRMAMLQGKGAFGGGPPVAPPPVGPKPVKRPPLVVPPPPADEDDETEKPHGESKQIEEHDGAHGTKQDVEDAVEVEDTKEEPTEEEPDEETKERERRAAIAARMARLGGARVGMAPPPIFGRKPDVKPKPKEFREHKEDLKEERKDSTSSLEDKVSAPEANRHDSATSDVSDVVAEENITSSEVKEGITDEIHQTVAIEEHSTERSGTQSSQASLPTITSCEARSTDSTGHQSSVPTSHSPPTSMPLPAAPRRAGPPRSRSARNIKSQAAKQEETIEAPPVPAGVSAVSAILAETSTGTEIHVAREEGDHDDPALASEPSVPEGGTIEAHVATAEESEEHVMHLSSPMSTQAEEPVLEALKSLDDAHPSENEEGESKVLAVSSKPEIDAKDYISHTPAPQQDVSESKASEPVVDQPDPPTHELHDEPIDDEASPVHKVHVDVATEEQAPIHSTVIEQQSPSSPPCLLSTVAEPFPEQGSSELTHQDNITIEVESEQSHTTTAEDETEEDESARRKRIAERMAKMGGRNPFAAGPLGITPRKASIEEPQEATNLAELEEPLTVEQDTHKDDIPREREVITERAVGSDNHEVEDLGPRATGMATEQRWDEDMHSVEAPLEEHEVSVSENKNALHLVAPLSEVHITPVSLPEHSSSIEDAEDMAPPRITRPIPPPPPQAHREGQAVLPIAIESKISSDLRSTSYLSQKPTQSPHASIAHKDDNVTSNLEGSRLGDVAASATVSPPLLEDKGETEGISPAQSPTQESIPSPRTLPVIPPPTEALVVTPVAESPTSIVSTSSRRSIPPVPRTVSPTSFRAVSPPARLPSAPRSVPTRAETTPSPTNSVRRSIPPPRRTPSNPLEETVGVPPTGILPRPSEESTFSPARRPSSSSVRASGRTISSESGVDDRALAVNREAIKEREVSGEPDPIDPTFHSTQRSPAASPPAQVSFSSESKQTSFGDAVEDDGEQARRRTIAERMAKLGGIKFGAPPPIPRKPAVAVAEASQKDVLEGDESGRPVIDDIQEPESEEAERARRQAISARLAGMGGMRFGMLPQIPAAVHPHARSDEDARTTDVPPLQQPFSGSIASDADVESDDGVKVDAESETSMEEVTAEDAVDEPEELPPPVPSRPPGGRRPPIPTSALPSRPPVPPTEADSYESLRTPTGASVVSASQSEFVVVGDPIEEEEIPPPPPARVARPSRSIPPPAPPVPSASSTRDMTNSQWELPDIPTGSLDVNVGGGLRMESSISSEDSITYPPAPSSHPPPQSTSRTESTPTPAPPAPHSEVQLSADELLQLWDVVGTAVHSAAANLFDKSKKKVIGDGTSKGFVMAALAQVPQASKSSYGHLVYSQNAHAVSRRSSNIMPGDIIQLAEAKLKGHKGLQSYNQTVGTAQEPLVAVVSEFDAKKSKVKVFQANQHVGAQTVETATYRLEDLKSGSIKVFRVASA